jgi:hypothetical protein
MKKTLIDRDFICYTNHGAVHIILTAHLFQKRNKNNEKRYRSYMFQSRWQYDDIITAGFEGYNLADFANKGRVALVFIYQNEQFGMLLDVVSSPTKGVDFEVTIITIDKLRDRHYTHAGMFNKENNKIYTKYVLGESFLLRPKKRLETVKNFEFLQTDFFEKKIKKIKMDREVDFIRIYHSIMSRVIKGQIAHNTSLWVSLSIADERDIYLRISVEGIMVKTSCKIGILMVDIASSKDFVESRAAIYNEELIDIKSMTSENFGKYEVAPLNKGGLKIKKKNNS